ncbi:MAG: ABC transporter ATP-binding protein [Epsilonproteobacteria bacterium]|nr:MAG: ABC transporter ATP-binding protein [Campylobacterota bacterium]
MNNIVINISNINKIYSIYDKPIDRIKEAINPFNKKYHKEFNALYNMSFKVKKGETVGIIGKNGAGKSTLLKIITGVLTQSSGTIKVNGKISSLLELGAGFNPEMTGIENIYLNGNLMGFFNEEIDKKLEAILEFADIGDFVYQPVKTYSSGMFARLAFATAINVEPDILIVDEALSVGDIFFQQKCFNHIKNNLDGVTKLFVTHDMASLTQMADRIIVLKGGEIAFDGDPLEAIKIYQEEEHQKKIYKNINSKNSIEPLSVISKFNHIEDIHLTGILDIKIIGHLFLVNGTPNESVSTNDNIELLLEIEALRDSEGECVVGLLFRDKQAQMLFGENTLNKILTNISIKQGISTVSIKFKWPSIKRGEYTYTPGIGEINPNNDLEHNIQCWANNIGKVYSTTGQKHDCLFSLEIDEINIKKEN